MVHQLILHALAAVTLTAGAGPRLDVKPGLWELKSTSSTKVEGDLPTSDLSKAPPEVRARIEAMRERLKSGKPRTTVRQSCVTQEDIDKGQGFDENEKNEDCERKYLDRSPRHIRFQVACASKETGMKSHGEFEVTVKSSDLVLVHGDFEIHDPRHESRMKMEVTARRLGSGCGDVKPGRSKLISE